ncbi:DUF3667 domain-containing protein [Paraflavitalea pollutisoli]|uniref:DUF3667 domain-containing protein n=1 Tax=Paraflavitalea pollutisoli TaxID=3034143 RepID=UPI0023EB4530|nr:DUF3667 domain-containing protein [Paraflavitalea sp. H1-2-19X]
MTCRHCNTAGTLHYCPNCGQPVSLKRINGHYIIHEVEHVLHFEKGILYTIRELLTKPGENVRRFITDDRSRLVKPIIFLIVTSTIYSLVSHFFHIEDGYIQYKGFEKSATGSIFNWVQGHYGYSNILMGLFIAFWTKLFFKKYGFNAYEILILLCFAIGMEMLFLSVFAIIQGITHVHLMQVSVIISLIYCSWAIGQFFDKKKAGNYFKALAAYLLGMMTFSLVAIAIGITIDLLIKH